ncbi:LysE family translocator [Sphingorhabdus sp. Alg239-R122]|uniref:LysE family translocator n=1 Tax=Sphingorhabdus sp. Alg239-R122 TaxID=2305989 RepID=UPI0013DB1FEF|nr:LysE family translocator [Sphingorhabdus sp. Alg239-R122]
MELSVYLIFFVTTAIVIFVPGPAAIAIAAQGAGNGHKRATFGVFGVAAANAVYFILSAMGIASLLIASAFVFNAIKWIGVAYLIYLGLTAIFSKTGGIQFPTGKLQSAVSLFGKGFIVEFASPKALLYFAAILPQFLDVSRPIVPQMLLMGGTTVAFDLISYSLYAYVGDRLTSGAVKEWIVRLINRVAGGALLLAGARMASV